MLHTLLDDQSRKCCFNSKNHISSPVHKLIIENYAAGQRGEQGSSAGEREKKSTSPESLLQYTVLTNVQTVDLLKMLQTGNCDLCCKPKAFPDGPLLADVDATHYMNKLVHSSFHCSELPLNNLRRI